jgi:ectoine hydroxylase-related dioxygenase (phytanoyl-CoA dioxygenase family)
MPRSHTGGVVRHRQLPPGGGAPEIRVPGRNPSNGYLENPSNGYLEIADADLPGDKAVPVSVDRGGVVLLTNRTAHRSTPNHSDIVRWSMDIRYQSTNLPTNYPMPTRRVDGIGRNATNMSTEKQALSCYPPEPDFLVRSRSRPASVVGTWEAFHAHRRTHEPAASTARWEDA